MNIIMTAVVATSLVSLAACGSAETKKGDAPAVKAESADTHVGTGKVDRVAGTEVTIAHGPIETIGWPSMTMSFTAKDAALLNGIKAGDSVSFAFTKTGSTFTLTSISKK